MFLMFGYIFFLIKREEITFLTYGNKLFFLISTFWDRLVARICWGGGRGVPVLKNRIKYIQYFIESIS